MQNDLVHASAPPHPLSSGSAVEAVVDEALVKKLVIVRDLARLDFGRAAFLAEEEEASRGRVEEKKRDGPATACSGLDDGLRG